MTSYSDAVEWCGLLVTWRLGISTARETMTRESGCGVATIGRLVKIIGLFCRILFLLLGSIAKETYDFKESTNCSHPIGIMTLPRDNG